MKKTEPIIAFIFLLVVLFLGATFLVSSSLFLRLIVGMMLGYSLTRGYTGFAGSVNRAINTGSTKLMRSMMLMFFIAAAVCSGLYMLGGVESFDLWILPINLGLIVGAILFGFGMSFSVCCASGVLTDLVVGFPRAFVTLIFFMLGVFIGFPIQRTASWVNFSWFTSETGKLFDGGVFLPDLFKFDGLNGYLGAIILVAIFCIIVSALAYLYEKKRRANGTYTGVLSEKMTEAPMEFDMAKSNPFSMDNYRRVVVKPWNLTQASIALAITFIFMMMAFHAGWGASTPYGMWFGKILMVFGVSADSLAAFTKMAPEFYTRPFFEHPINVQNFGILLGTIFYLLSAGVFKQMVSSELNHDIKHYLLYALGGITMGFGTRLANGCNVGALFTPVANLSLSGWFFLVFMIVGGILGAKFGKLVKA